MDIMYTSVILAIAIAILLAILTKGDLRRRSAKRTIGGLIVVYALTSMNGEITTNGIILCGVGILPLCLSFLEKD